MSGASQTVTPLWTSRIRIGCALAVFVASLILYTWTLAPTVTLVDSGELIVAAGCLGVAHPPGFPLYVLLAHLATLVPIGSVAGRVNFASALFAALAASVAALVVIEGMITVGLSVSARKATKSGERGKRGRKAAATPAHKNSSRLTSDVLVVSCMISGLLLAFSRTLWAYATIAEVYTLNSLLILMIFLLMFRWRRQFIEATRRQKSETAPLEEESKSSTSPEDRALSNSRSSPIRPAVPSLPHGSLYAAAFLFGLALGVHHVTVGLMLPALAALVFATENSRFFASRRFIYAALFAFAGLIVVYAYLPIAASQAPIMNWGDPRTFERLWWHISGKQYQVFFLSFSLEAMASQFIEFIKVAAREFGPWWFPAGPALATAGLAAILRRDKTIFWFLTLVIVADLAYALWYEIAEDKDAYYLPAFIAMTIAAGFGAEWFINKVTSPLITSKPARSIAVSLVLLVPIAALAGNWAYDNRGRYLIAQDYVDNILSTIEPGGMLLTRDWQVYSPMLYFQAIEHRRPDTVVIDVNQLRRSWYFDYLRRAYPATIERARDQVDAFLEDLRHWEHDPDLYQKDLVLNQRINSRFFEMILAFIADHMQSAPVYVTLDIAANRDGPDAELTKSLAALYQFIPQGLTFQVTSDHGFRQPADPHLVTRGLVDGTMKFEDEDVVKQKVLPAYVNMLYNRGRYLAANGRHEEAIEAFKFSLAQQAMNESLNSARKGAANKTQ